MDEQHVVAETLFDFLRLSNVGCFFKSLLDASHSMNTSSLARGSP